jgi:hypothetical protein
VVVAVSAVPIESYRLRTWEEAIGQFHELQEQEGHLLTRIGPVMVLLPLEMKDKLKDLVGHRIAVLRTENDYRMRILPDHLGGGLNGQQHYDR